MAACRLASKGKTLADSSFSCEVQSIQSFLAMQKTTPSNNTAQTDESINTHSLVSPRYQKKYKPKQVPHLEYMFDLVNYCIIHYTNPLTISYFAATYKLPIIGVLVECLLNIS